MSELERLRALLGEMTPGPVRLLKNRAMLDANDALVGRLQLMTDADAVGAVALRNLFPSLLAVVEAATEEHAVREEPNRCPLCVALDTLLADIRKELGE